MRELLSLPAGARAPLHALATLAGALGGIVGLIVGALLGWPLGRLEAVIGFGLPYVIIAGGVRLLWAGYMLLTVIVFVLIARLTD